MKKKKLNKKGKIGISKKYVIPAIIAFSILFYIFFSVIYSKYEKYKNEPQKINSLNIPLLYINSDDELKYLYYNKPEPSTIAKNVEDIYISAYNIENKKQFMYVRNQSLYLVDAKNSEDITKLAADFDEYGYYNGYFYYTIDETLYIINLKNNDKVKIDYPASSIISAFGDYYIYIKDDVFYLRSFDESKDEKINLGNVFYDDEYMDGASSTIIVSKDLNKIMYIENSNDEKDLVIYDVKKNSKDVIGYDIEYINDYTDDFSKVVYTSKDKNYNTKDLLFIIDLNLDDYADIYRNYDYTTNKYTYYYYKNDQKVATTEEKYNLYNKNYWAYKVIEGYFGRISGLNENKYSYKVYLYDEGKVTTLVNDVAEINNVDLKNEIIIYSTFHPFKRLHLSRIKSIEEIENAYRNITYDSYYKTFNSEPITLESNSASSVRARIIDINTIYKYDYNDENETFNMYKVNINNIDEPILLGTNIASYDYNYDEAYIFFENFNSKNMIGDIKVILNGEKYDISIDTEINYVTYDNDYIYFIDNYDTNNYSGDFCSYSFKTKRKEVILENVHNVIYLEKGKYYIGKDFSKKANTYDLYIYKNNKLELIEYAIRTTNYFDFYK